MGGGGGGALILTMCFPSSVFCQVFFPLLPLSESVLMAAGTADTMTKDKEVISDSKWNVAGN